MRSVLGERVIGICDTPIGLVNRTLNALGVADEERTDVSFDYVGLNHLGWLRSLSVDGRDILPRLFADEAALGSMEESRAIGTDWIRALGALPNEYLFYYYCHREAMARIHQDQTRGEYLRDQQEAFYNAVLAGPSRRDRRGSMPSPTARRPTWPRPATSTSVPAGAPRILRAAATKRWPSTS